MEECLTAQEMHMAYTMMSADERKNFTALIATDKGEAVKVTKKKRKRLSSPKEPRDEILKNENYYDILSHHENDDISMRDSDVEEEEQSLRELRAVEVMIDERMAMQNAKKPKHQPTINSNTLTTTLNSLEKLNIPSTSGTQNNTRINTSETINTKLNNNNNRNTPPALTIINSDYTKIKKILQTKMITNYTIKITNNRIRLNLKNKEDHENVKKELITHLVEFFTYTNRDEKPITYLIKGIHHSHQPFEIKDELEQLYPEQSGNIINITAFSTAKSNTENKKLNMFLIQFKNGTNMRDFVQCTGLLHQKISWEPIKKTNSITQCKRCQRLGHTASNCHLNYRCVKCPMEPEHSYGECPITRTDDNNREQLYCINCRKYGHPATFRGCETYMKIKLKIQQQARERQQQNIIRQQSYKNYIIPGINFNQVTKLNNYNNRINDQQQHAPPNLNQNSNNQNILACLTQLTETISSLTKIIKSQCP